MVTQFFEWVQKQKIKGKIGLVPRKVQVRRGGRIFQAIRWTKEVGTPKQDFKTHEIYFNKMSFKDFLKFGMQQKLSQKERHAVEDYGEDSRSLNAYLRQKKSAKDEDAEYNNWTANIDGAMKKYKFPFDVIVYRGISGRGQKKLFDLKEEEVFFDRGFVSVTPILKIASAYTSKSILKIRIPKGTSFAYGAWTQKEFVLPRNSKFKILGKSEEKTKYEIMRVMEATLLQ